MSDRFDLIVVGSGPGGQRAAIQAAKLGKKVVIIEKDELGGSSLHRGTIPSKTLREAILSERLEDPGFLQRALEKTRELVTAETQLIHEQLKRNGVEVARGVAGFADKKTLVVRESAGTERVYSADFVLLATGTRPRRPPEIRFVDDRIFDSDGLLRISRTPSSLAVLGAGVIGCEYASIFAHLGTRVVVIDRRTDLLRGVDAEVVGSLRGHLESHGMSFRLGARFSTPQATGEGVEIEIEGQVQRFDALLYVMGRVGNVEDLRLEKAGLKPNDRGLITVDENFQTPVPGIYAVGDLIGSPALAASAAEQGRLAVRHGFGLPSPGFPKLFPYGIYTIPEISSVGMEEADLKSQAIPYVVGRAHYRELARGRILGDEFGFLKLLVHAENRKLLGIHVIGTHATELVHIGQMALSFGAKVDDLLELVFNYPTLAESYKVAGLNAYNQLSERPT